MRSTYSLDETMNALSEREHLVFILQDWDSGMQVYENYSGEETVQQLADARGKYGDRFGFRAFNEEVDIYWNGDFGVIFTGQGVGPTQQILLESDTKRYPGMAKFEADRNLRDLRIEAREITSEDGATFLRFVKLSEVKRDASKRSHQSAG